ncbi:MAG TPA: helix-turn-helix transcriptional regulator [Solirubrobacteraceae bacterium]|jgi:DNA-binding XRE family transcriptional regulator|nr:helix-turn-helix transcriptional regulator [Solirubrobacteraceae bacterium]
MSANRRLPQTHQSGGRQSGRDDLVAGDEEEPPGPLDRDASAASVAFGRRLRELRRVHGLSQEELADRTDMRSNAIGRLERGSREPRLTTILRIAHGLDVQPGALLDDLRAGA